MCMVRLALICKRIDRNKVKAQIANPGLYLQLTPSMDDINPFHLELVLFWYHLDVLSFLRHCFHSEPKQLEGNRVNISLMSTFGLFLVFLVPFPPLCENIRFQDECHNSGELGSNAPVPEI